MASDEMIRVDELLRQIAGERIEQAREASVLVAKILRAAPIRWVEKESGERVRSVLSIDMCEHTIDRLRDACALLTGIDGWELDHERLIGLLSFAVVRGGPLWSVRVVPDD